MKRVNQKIRSMDKESTIVMVVLTIFFIIVLGVAFMFVRMMNERNEMTMQMSAEKAFNNFLFKSRLDIEEKQLYVDDELILGLGTYNSEGLLIIGFGQIPEIFTPDEELESPLGRRSSASYNRLTGAIEYSRKVALSFGINDAVISTPEYVYISIDGKQYRLMRLIIYISYSLFCCIMFIFLLFTWRLYTRNRAFQETLAKQKSLVSLGEAARTLAHEIKNPLSAITLQTALLRKKLPAESHQDIRTIDEQVLRLNTLADRVREFIRNAKGNPEHLDIVEFISEIAETFGRDIPVYAEGCRHRFVDIDRDRARSAFENLIRNAVESRHDSDEDADVAIHCNSAGHTISITIIDTGDGLPEGLEKQIYDPFFTTKTQGSGIGLAITRRFIESAGGRLSHRNRSTLEGSLYADRGTAAEIILPGRDK